MNEQEAFEQIKAHEIEEFEETYGEEARERYGVDAIEASTARLLNMSHEEWDTKTMLEESIKEQLCQAMATRDTSSERSPRVGAHASEMDPPSLGRTIQQRGLSRIG